MTTIAWTEETWNPIAAYDKATRERGWFCTHASPGCLHCYAERMNTWRGNGHLYRVPNLEKVSIEIDRAMLVRPLVWRKPTMIFPCSMTDLFLDAHSDEMIDQVFAVMMLARNHRFQVLTKRAERMYRYLRSCELPARLARLAVEDSDLFERGIDGVAEQVLWADPTEGPQGIQNWPLPNVWVGVSAENQKCADERIPFLLNAPAAVRWVSYEPALGAVDFARYLTPEYRVSWGNSDLPPSEREKPTATDVAMLAQVARAAAGELNGQHFLDWIVIGGESGAGARPFALEWAADTVRQCQAAGVAPFVKQLGAVYAREHGFKDAKGEDPSEWPESLRVREMPEVTA